MTSVLVTGSGGQVGRSLQELAADPRFDHLEITFTDRATLDLAEPDTIVRTIERVGPDIVINAAAYTAVTTPAH